MSWQEPNVTRDFQRTRRHVRDQDRPGVHRSDHRAQKSRQRRIHRLAALRQRIYGSPKMLVGDRLGGDFRNAGAFQAAQDGRLRAGIARKVDDHHPQPTLGAELAADAQ
ncbi:MAG: hypothetical protein IAE88_11690 [Rhodobacteraceae bacterium]|nr:hypothetical protein [Paracoccaceae bacterium]